MCLASAPEVKIPDPAAPPEAPTAPADTKLGSKETLAAKTMRAKAGKSAFRVDTTISPAATAGGTGLNIPK